MIAVSLLSPEYQQSFAALLVGFALSEAWRAPAAIMVRDVSPARLGSTASAIHLCFRNLIGGLGPLGALTCDLPQLRWGWSPPRDGLMLSSVNAVPLCCDNRADNPDVKLTRHGAPCPTGNCMRDPELMMVSPAAVAWLSGRVGLQHAMLLVPACYAASGVAFVAAEAIMEKDAAAETAAALRERSKAKARKEPRLPGQ